MLVAGAVFAGGILGGWHSLGFFWGGGLRLEKFIHIDVNSLCTRSVVFSLLALAGWHLPNWGLLLT